MSHKTISPKMAKILIGAGVVALVVLNVALALWGGDPAAAKKSSSKSEAETTASETFPRASGDNAASEDEESRTWEEAKSNLKVIYGQQYLDELGEDADYILTAAESFLSSMGYSTDGLEVGVPKAAQSVETSGETVIWITIPDAEATLTVQGYSGSDLWQVGWLPQDQAAEIGVAAGSSSKSTTQAKMVSVTRASKLSGTLPQACCAGLADAWAKWVNANRAGSSVDSAEILADSISQSGDTWSFKMVDYSVASTPDAQEASYFKVSYDAAHGTFSFAVTTGE